MKNIIVCFLIAAVFFSCNTKQGSGEPTNDSKANPAEMAVDSVGAGTDIPDRASTDSNKTGDPVMSQGKSDLQTGSGDTTGKVLSSDGNIINKNKEKQK